MNLKEQYKNEVVAKLVEEFNYTSVMQTPKLEKIVVNMGVGEAINNTKFLDDAVADLEIITGQKPVITRAKKINC
ncbi:50S ribosomal protein L5 [Erysipelothrix rhusiopathiae SY1027]|nr:50S ribosomal protein L5 [Erysipelothrix rhusiopathiae SY1027]